MYGLKLILAVYSFICIYFSLYTAVFFLKETALYVNGGNLSIHHGFPIVNPNFRYHRKRNYHLFCIARHLKLIEYLHTIGTVPFEFPNFPTHSLLRTPLRTLLFITNLFTPPFPHVSHVRNRTIVWHAKGTSIFVKINKIMPWLPKKEYEKAKLKRQSRAKFPKHPQPGQKRNRAPVRD